MRDSFVFYRSFFELFRGLGKARRWELLEALCDYAFAGVLPEPSAAIYPFFCALRPQIDANNRRYENGKKGGRPRCEEENLPASQNQRFSSEEPNENVNEHENEKEKEKEKENVHANEHENGNANANANVPAGLEAGGILDVIRGHLTLRDREEVDRELARMKEGSEGGKMPSFRGKLSSVGPPEGEAGKRREAFLRMVAGLSEKTSMRGLGISGRRKT